MTAGSTLKRIRKCERDARKQYIVSAAMKLLEEKSFYEIGVRNIAVEVGVSVASIYTYFHSRDDIFLEVLLQNIYQIKRQLEKCLENEANTDDLAAVVVDYFIDNKPTFQIMSHFLISFGINEKTMKRFNAVRMYFRRIFGESIKKAHGCENTCFFTDAFFASLAGAVMTFRFYPGRTSEERRKYIHKLAFLIMTEGYNLDFLTGMQHNLFR